MELELFNGLKALAESSFPKRCANCGRVFETAEQFVAETEVISQDRTGLKASLNDDDSTIVELFRNCPCGSTLMDFFTDRRDLSAAGLKRRQRFQELQDYLVGKGLDRTVARNELLKIMRGQKSDVLANFKAPK